MLLNQVFVFYIRLYSLCRCWFGCCRFCVVVCCGFTDDEGDGEECFGHFLDIWHVHMSYEPRDPVSGSRFYERGDNNMVSIVHLSLGLTKTAVRPTSSVKISPYNMDCQERILFPILNPFSWASMVIGTAPRSTGCQKTQVNLKE